MALIHTLQTSRLPMFFTQENVNTIKDLFDQTIAQNFDLANSKYKKIVIPQPHIIRTMQSVHEEYLEDIASMNQRVCMILVRSFMNDINTTERNNYWSSNYWNAINYQNLGIKQFETPNIRGKKVGRSTTDMSQVRFNFTY